MLRFPAAGFSAVASGPTVFQLIDTLAGDGAWQSLAVASAPGDAFVLTGGARQTAGVPPAAPSPRRQRGSDAIPRRAALPEP